LLLLFIGGGVGGEKEPITFFWGGRGGKELNQVGGRGKGRGGFLQKEKRLLVERRKISLKGAIIKMGGRGSARREKLLALCKERGGALGRTYLLHHKKGKAQEVEERTGSMGGRGYSSIKGEGKLRGKFLASPGEIGKNSKGFLFSLSTGTGREDSG